MSAPAPTFHRVLISTREAAKELAVVGVPRRQVRRLIACGAAGPVTRTAGALLVDDRRVADLASRPRLSEADLTEACPWGVFIARREVRGSQDREVLGQDWPFSIWTMARLRAWIDRYGFVPLVATVSGFVLDGGQITGVTPQVGAELFDLALDPPGPWFDRLQGTRIDSPPGRPWMVLGWDARARVGCTGHLSQAT